jgi:hypothetical protein
MAKMERISSLPRSVMIVSLSSDDGSASNRPVAFCSASSSAGSNASSITR